MSKQAKSSKPSKEGQSVDMMEINSHLDQINYRKTENLEFECRYFIISMLILISMNVLINKSNFQNYNFKLIILTIIYLSRRVINKLWHYYQIKEIIISRFNYWVYMISVLLLLCNSLYLIFDLLATYKLYNILSLFYPLLLQMPMFWFDKEKRYANPVREFSFSLKKIVYFSLELCYYCIFVPALFSKKYNIYLNQFAMLFFSIFTFLNSFILLSGYVFYKKSAEFHFQSKILGGWKPVKENAIPIEVFPKIKSWNKQNIPYKIESYVQVNTQYYISLEQTNIVSPIDKFSHLFYYLFVNPRKSFWKLVGYQGFLTITLLATCAFSQINVFSISLGVCSWYTFFILHNISKKLKKIFNK